MRNLKFLASCVVTLLCALSAHGQEEEATCLTLRLKDGTTAAYLLADRPQLTFDGSLLKISSESVSADYERGEVDRFDFVAVSVAVESVRADGSFRLSFTDNATVDVDGASDPLRLYDAAGRLLRAAAPSGGKARLRVGDLPTGTYIVNINRKQTVKIYKK